MSQTCPYCNGGTVPTGHNHLPYKCQDCDGTGHVVYCVDCGDQMPGYGEERCCDCHEIYEDDEAAIEFIELLTDSRTDAHDLADQIGEGLIKIKPRLITICHHN